MTIDFTQLATLRDTIVALVEAIPPVVNRDGRQYPFIGEKGVRRALDDNPALKQVNAVLMYHLQTAVEQGAKETIEKNKRGLMSSHAATASKLIASLLVGAEPDPETVYKADGFSFVGHEAYLTHVGSRYAKQLSVALRSAAIAAEPELAVTAGMFSVR